MGSNDVEASQSSSATIVPLPPYPTSGDELIPPQLPSVKPSSPADPLPTLIEEAAAPRIQGPQSRGSRRPQSSGSQRRSTGLGAAATRNWFDLQPSDWVERRRRCPRPQSAPVKRLNEDPRKEPYPQRVRELLLSRQAEKDRVSWIDRLTVAPTMKPERHDKFLRWQFEAARNIAKIEEELGKIAVRRKPKPKQREDLGHLDSLDHQRSAGSSPAGTPTYRGNSKDSRNSEEILKCEDVGMDREEWLMCRLHPDYDPEKARAASQKSHVLQTSPKQKLGVGSRIGHGSPGKPNSMDEEFGTDSVFVEDVLPKSGTRAGGSPSPKGKQKAESSSPAGRRTRGAQKLDRSQSSLGQEGEPPRF